MRRQGLVAATMAAAVLAASGAWGQQQGKYVSYDDVIKAVKEGRVKSVTLAPSMQFTGEMTVDIRTVAFTTLRPVAPSSDPLLTGLLKEKKVEVKTVGQQSSGVSEVPLLAMIFVFIVPAVTLVVVLIINHKLSRIAAGGSLAMGPTREPRTDSRE